MTTAVGGGLLRDVVANRDPQLFNTHDIYAVPAMLGAGLTAALWSLGLLVPLTQLLVAGLVFLFRMLSLRYGWRVPQASGRTGADEHSAE